MYVAIMIGSKLTGLIVQAGCPVSCSKLLLLVIRKTKTGTVRLGIAISLWTLLPQRYVILATIMNVKK